MLSACPRIKALEKEDTLTVEIAGSFDLSLAFDLWHTCRLEPGRYRRYIFDLATIGELRDSGLAWLMMFRRHALQSGACVLLTNCSLEVARRCEAVGLELAAPRFPDNEVSTPDLSRARSDTCMEGYNASIV